MSPAKKRTCVGLFTMTGLALLISGIIALGGGRLLSNETEYVLYFGSSVNGLSIGAPVMFRGVPLGSVSRISLVANANRSNVTIPVYITIQAKNLILASGTSVQSEEDEQTLIRSMVNKGMRARLQFGSLITGQYRIELDFFPETLANFRSATPMVAIPTIPSPIDNFQKSLEKVSVETLVSNLENILVRFNELINNGNIERGLKAFSDTFTNANDVMLSFKNMTGQLEKIVADIEYSTTVAKKELPISFAAFQSSLNDFSAAFHEFKRFSSNAERFFAPNSPVSTEAQRMLRELSAAARSLRFFAETLERNPEALLKGRQGAY